MCGFNKTRSYAVLRAADLDWIVGPGYSLGGYILKKKHEKQTWNHEKPTWNHETPLKPTWNHEKPTWNHETQPGTMKNQTGTMKNHEA